MFDGVPPNMSVSTSTPVPLRRPASSAAPIAAAHLVDATASARCRHREEPRRVRHDQAQRLQELLAEPVVRHDHDADLHALFSTSRCSTFTSRPLARAASLASASATATRAVAPPVQPIGRSVR